MKAMVFLKPDGFPEQALGEWVASAAAFARKLPPKPGRARRYPKPLQQEPCSCSPGTRSKYLPER